MNDITYTQIYQALFQAFNRLNDADEDERQIAFMVFGVMNKMEELWGNE